MSPRPLSMQSNKPTYYVDRMPSQHPITLVCPDQKIESIYAEVVEPAKRRTNKKYIMAVVAGLVLVVSSVAMTLLILSGALSRTQLEPVVDARAEQLIESTQVPLPRVNSYVVVNKARNRPVALRQLRWNRMSSTIETPAPTTAAEPVSQLPAVNGIFWSDAAEASVPIGFHSRQAMHWKSTVKGSSVVDIRDGCGRLQNRLVELNDQVLSCARYRQNNDQIQGELFSFFLAQLLEIPNVVPVVATRVVGKQWADVEPKVQQARWQLSRPVLLSRYIDDLEPAFIPEMLRDKNRHLHPSDIRNMTRSQIQELVQWSDLIVFDYLTANLDRIVNNLYNLQWNTGMMSAPAHNLMRNPKTGLLVFLDNESGLVHGYRLLEKYNGYHKSLLQALCVFRKQTIAAVRRLGSMSVEELSQQFQKALDANSPAMDDVLPFLPHRSIETLRQRLKQVDEQVEKCQAQYTPLKEC